MLYLSFSNLAGRAEPAGRAPGSRRIPSAAPGKSPPAIPTPHICTAKILEMRKGMRTNKEERKKERILTPPLLNGVNFSAESQFTLDQQCSNAFKPEESLSITFWKIRCLNLCKLMYPACERLNGLRHGPSICHKYHKLYLWRKNVM